MLVAPTALVIGILNSSALTITCNTVEMMRLPPGEPVGQLAGRAVLLAHGTADAITSPAATWAYAERARALTSVTEIEVRTGEHTMLWRAPLWHGLAAAVTLPLTGGPMAREAVAPTGGEAWPLTDWSSGVLHFDWAGPETLVFAAQETPTLRASKLKEDKDDTVVVEDERHEPPVRLFRVEASSTSLFRNSPSTSGAAIPSNSSRANRYEAEQCARICSSFIKYDLVFLINTSRARVRRWRNRLEHSAWVYDPS